MIQFLLFQPSKINILIFDLFDYELRFGEVAWLIRTWFTAKVAPLYLISADSRKFKIPSNQIMTNLNSNGIKKIHNKRSNEQNQNFEITQLIRRN